MNALSKPEPANEPLPIQKILVPTALPPEHGVLVHARRLAEHLGAGLALYHAVEVPEHRYAHWAFAHGQDIWRRAETEARHVLEWQAGELGAGVEATVERAAGAADALMARIDARRPDLVVMATHGRTGLTHLLIGSITERVIHGAGRPVLCLRGGGEDAAFPYRRILVTTDFSAASRRVFAAAAHLARVCGAEILALHVAVGEPGQPLPVARTDGQGPALSAMLAAEFPGLLSRMLLDRGTVWKRIVQVAESEGADLIAMSTRGHHGLADHLLGSNTERVIRHAPCPVLVY
jgi:nucleotide-binding universal stress UspA family protein